MDLARRLPVLLASFFLITGCAFVNVPMLAPDRPLDERVLEGSGRKKILIVGVSGILSERASSGRMLLKGEPSPVDRIREELGKAEEDDDIAGVIVRINSPGGTVTASDIIHHEIAEFRRKRDIPVFACIMGVGTSGGYYIATAADRIYAHPTAITGSIGVLLLKFNVQGLLDKVGVQEQTVKSGDKKDMLSPFRAGTPEEQMLVQDVIDRLHTRFLDVVMARPNNTLTRSELKTLADGRIYTADQALAARLIDGTGYLDEVIGDLKRRAGLDQARIVVYFRPGSYKGSIYSGGAADPAPISGIVGMLEGADLLPEAGFMFLWQP